MSAAHSPILFYDDSCGLCTKGVQWLAGGAMPGQVRAVGISGPEGQVLLARRPDLAEARSVIWREALPGGGERILIRSDAVFAAISARGGGWRLVGLLSLVPRRLRDAAYLWFAAHRHRFSGGASRASCAAGPEDPQGPGRNTSP